MKFPERICRSETSKVHAAMRRADGTRYDTACGRTFWEYRFGVVDEDTSCRACLAKLTELDRRQE